MKEEPILRFNFNGNWKIKTISELYSFSKGKGIPKSELNSEGAPCILYGELYTIYNCEINKIISKTKITGSLIESKGNEVLIPASGETATDIATAFALTIPKVLIGGDINILTPKEEATKNTFFARAINKKKNIIKNRAQGNSVVHLNREHLSDIKIHYPETNEQNKISSFLQLIDKKITLQQSLIENIKEYKKGCLQCMFPKNDNKTPSIRFPEFTDDWKRRKLGEITKIKTGSSDLQDAISDGKYPMFVRSENIERSNRYIFDGEAILIPGEGRLGDIYHYINGKFDFHQRVYKISDFNIYIVSGKFVLFDLQSNFKQHALKFTVKATVDSLRLPMLTDYKINIPEINEQCRIGVFFDTLDNIITLHQSKLEKIQELKKGLLQQMFV